MKGIGRFGLGLLAGAGLGYGVFWVLKCLSPLDGRAWFTLGGAICGVLLTGMYPRWRRWLERFSISSVQLQIPQVGQVTFQVNAQYRRVAWRLFVETITRVATQPLGPEEGFIREALNSLHGLFATTRDLLKAMEPSQVRMGNATWTVEMFAVSMLNNVLRPFLSKWHPLLSAFVERYPGKPEAEWEQNDECRRELEDVRQELLGYARGFGELAGVAKLDHFIPKIEE